MSEKVIPLRGGQASALGADGISDATPIVMINVLQLKQVIREVIREEQEGEKRHGDDELLKVKGAANFLGYSPDWIYRHWKKIGGRKLGLGGLRFSRQELKRWVASRKVS